MVEIKTGDRVRYNQHYLGIVANTTRRNYELTGHVLALEPHHATTVARVEWIDGLTTHTEVCYLMKS